MRTLLWKEYRQNRRLLLAAIVFVLFPYVVTLAFSAGELWIEGRLQEPGWAGRVHGAAIAGMLVSFLLTPFVAGNAIASERADGSAEFAAYLPIPRAAAAASKALMSIGLCTVFWVANIATFYATRRLQADWSSPVRDEFVWGLLVTAVFMFGVSWLFSALLSSPALAAVAGLAAMIALGMVMSVLEETRGGQDSLRTGNIVVILLIGVGCFIAGVVHFLYRSRP